MPREVVGGPDTSRPDTPSDVKRFEEFLEYLISVGLADDPPELR